MSFVPGTERRQFGRKEVSIEALAQASGRPAVRCLIKNISLMGALLEFEAPFASRGNFRLFVDRKLDVTCQIRRQDGKAVGVEFATIVLHELMPSTATASTKAPVYEGVQKREVVASSGFEMRARLFGKPAPVPTVAQAILTTITAPEVAAVASTEKGQTDAAAPDVPVPAAEDVPAARPTLGESFDVAGIPIANETTASAGSEPAPFEFLDPTLSDETLRACM